MIRNSFRVGVAPTPLDFILQREVFRLDEFEAPYRQMKRSPESAKATLAYHVKSGRL